MITDQQPHGPNVLTQREAETRAGQIHDVRYSLTLALELGADSYRGETTIQFQHRTPGEGTFLDFTGGRIERLEVNGSAIESPVWEANRVRLDGRLLQRENRVRIQYRNRYDHTGVGFHQFVDPEDRQEYIYTNFEPYDAHRLFPCFDQPDIKGRYELTVTAPADWVVVSNSATAASEPEAEGHVRHRFAQTPPFSTYLLAVIAGPYERFENAHGDIPLRLFCRRSLARALDQDELFTITKQGLDFFSEFFDYPYPFAKYDQLFVPEFNAGAMENVAAITFSERMIFRDPPTDTQRLNRSEVILHEMAHMWFGDLVTMRWWNDLWLNESFATYMAYLSLAEATRFQRSWLAFNFRMKGWAYREDQLVTTHPIAGTVSDTDATFQNFDGITYGKGAAVLKQLMAVIGRDGFRAGMRHYFRTYEWRNTSLREFLGSLEQGAQRDLGEWARLWLESAGLNSLKPAWETDNGRITAFSMEQSAPAEHPTLRPHQLDIAIFDLDTEGVPQLRSIVPVEVGGPRTAVDALAAAPAPACIFSNLGDHAYAKIMLDDRSLAFVLERLERFTDPLLRQLLWRALWDMVRDQQLRSTEYLALAREKIVFEQDLDLIEAVLGTVWAALSQYVPDDKRVGEANALFDVAWERLHAATATDGRIVWARAAIGAAQDEDSITRLLELADRGSGIDGFELDQEMRWSLAALAIAFGLPDAGARVAEEERRDPSDRGQRSEVLARSAAPDAAMKAAAWERFGSDRESSLHMIRAAMNGFQWWHQRALLEPYSARFFAEVEAVFQSRNKEFAQAYFGALFPYDSPDGAVIAETEALLARLGGSDQMLRRTTLEALDDLRRARACRALAAAP